MCWRPCLCGQTGRYGASGQWWAPGLHHAVSVKIMSGNKRCYPLHGGSLASFWKLQRFYQLAREQAAIRQVDSIEAGHAAMPVPVNL